jgi:RHS repeat-associated protein
MERLRTCAKLVNYVYDANPLTGSTTYMAGRLGGVAYAGANCQGNSGSYGPWVSGNNYNEAFAYTQAGQVTNKTFRLIQYSAASGSSTIYGTYADLQANYTYDQEGKMLTQNYPLGDSYTYTYDSLGRSITMTDTTASSNLVTSVSYNPDGTLSSMSGTAASESRYYNTNGQVTQITGTGLNVTYNYPTAGSNNGQIASQYDAISGETVTYAYDSLKRLSSASSSLSWNQNFTYDGFGNLTAKTGSGIAPVGSYPTSLATNQLTTGTYDSNGNYTSNGGGFGANLSMAYDTSNRMTSSTSSSLQGFNEYNPSNKRVYQMQQTWSGSAWTTTSQTYYFYGVKGQKIGSYNATFSGYGIGATITWAQAGIQVFFKGRMIQRTQLSGGFGTLTTVQQDLRASIGKYFPYGEEETTPPGQNDQVKFATYTRDAVSGLDYAMNRYYELGGGRFTSADPYQAKSGGSEDPAVPGGWNRYSYVLSDPVSNFDQWGLTVCSVNGQGLYTCYDSITVTGTVETITPVTFTPGGGGGGGGSVCNGSASYGCLMGSVNAQQHPGIPCETVPFPGSNINGGYGEEQIDANVALADSTYAGLVSQYGKIEGLARMIGWLTLQFMPTGPWDYKFGSGVAGTPDYQDATVFGNFNFGAVMASLGLSYTQTQSAAGAAQTLICAGGGSCGTGLPFNGWPYGDQEGDASVIYNGWAWYTQLKAGVCH